MTLTKAQIVDSVEKKAFLPNKNKASETVEVLLVTAGCLQPAAF